MTSSDKNYKLIDFGNLILEKKSLPDGLPLIALYSKKVIGADRCSVFIYNLERSELWTTLADGIEKIVIPSNQGIVGKTLKSENGIIENHVYSNNDFFADIDTGSGYVTNNIITEPIYDSAGRIVGVLELLNKDGGFDESDAKHMKFFAKSLSNFIELIKLQEA